MSGGRPDRLDDHAAIPLDELLRWKWRRDSRGFLGPQNRRGASDPR